MEAINKSVVNKLWVPLLEPNTQIHIPSHSQDILPNLFLALKRFFIFTFSSPVCFASVIYRIRVRTRIRTHRGIIRKMRMDGRWEYFVHVQKVRILFYIYNIRIWRREQNKKIKWCSEERNNLNVDNNDCKALGISNCDSCTLTRTMWRLLSIFFFRLRNNIVNVTECSVRVVSHCHKTT